MAYQMKKIGKKAFIFRIIGFIILVIVIVLLVFLIKNEWDVISALKEFLDFVAKLKE